MPLSMFLMALCTSSLAALTPLIIEKMNVDYSERNILVAHQFVTGSERCDSEDISVGGLDNVDASVFEGFDYVALGHLHGCQKTGSEKIYYSGTPLKYSFSEVNHKKGGLVVELDEKGTLKVEQLLFEPLHEMREIRGTYNELTLKKNYENTAVDDYLHITLTDEEDIPEGFTKLSLIYKNLVRLDYDNTRTRTDNHIEAAANIDKLSPLELFESFYELQNNQPFSEEQKKLAQNLIEEIWGGEK